MDRSWYNDSHEYFIYTAEQFAYFVELAKSGYDFKNKTITLMSSIDFNSNELEPIETFAGTFNGNGNAIFNLRISGSTRGGLISNNTGTIMKLEIINITVTAVSSSAWGDAYCYAGGLAGYNYGTINECSVSGQVSADASAHADSGYCAAYAYAGGIAGYNEGVISNTYAKVKVYATTYDRSYSSNFFSFGFAGGLVGYNTGTVSYCYTAGATVRTSGDGSSTGGGLIGRHQAGKIYSCCTTVSGSASGSYYSFSGGIVGTSAGIVENCYDNRDEKMQTVLLYTETLGWNSEIWCFIEGTYPALKK